MEKNMETAIMGYIGTIRTIHSFIPGYPKANISNCQVIPCRNKFMGSGMRADGLHRTFRSTWT